MTSSRMAIRPSPLMSAGRASIRQTCSWWSCSSAASSMVTIRSSTGMKPEQTLSRVVFPVPVPPLINMFARARTQARRKAADASVRVPNRIRSSTWYGSLENFRMVSIGPSTAIGGTTALTRDPSRRRASQSGWRIVDAPARPRRR